MSNIEPNIIDPTGAPPPSPDVIVPEIEPDDDDIAGDDAVREPDSDTPAIEPDPEESNPNSPPIRHAGATQS